MTTELAKQYRPADVEPDILKRWNQARAFHADPSDPGRPYCVVIPPPNVTAALHMGHALNNTLQDILIRWRRMLGDNTLWMPGTDHAGIATQTVVEKRVLSEEGKKRTDFGRDEFIKKIQAWKDEYEQTILGQLKSMGCSCDWDRTRFTMDPVCAAAVREAFFRLFKDGLIYRGKRLVNWDPATQTALADDEVEMEEIDGHFYYLRYPLIGPPLPDGTNYVTVATTRPETMLGDTAVAINPKDPRAAMLRGRVVLLPIVNREIPIVEDDYVVLPSPPGRGWTAEGGPGEGTAGREGSPDSDNQSNSEVSSPQPSPSPGSGRGGQSEDPKAKYATGFLKVTPAHDPNDWEIGLRHKLAVINILAPDATISKDHGWPADEWDKNTHPTNDADFLLGMDRFKARKAIVKWFKEHEMLEETKPYRHSVGHSYRSHVAIEPYLSDQWYVKVTDEQLAGAALRAMVVEQRAPSPLGRGWTAEGGPGEGTTGGEGSPNADHPSNSKIPSPQPSPNGRGGQTAATRGGSLNEAPGSRSDPAAWQGNLRFHPARYARTFEQWHENIRDWCISRQLWWGHRIPVWYKRVSAERGQIIDKKAQEAIAVAQAYEDYKKNTAVIITPAGVWNPFDWQQSALIQWVFNREPHGDFDVFICICTDNPEGINPHELEAAGFVQDPDVLDTWFSSALWPISTLGWPNPAQFPQEFPGGDAALNKWNPSNLLCTAREIITLWVSRMTMFNLYFRGCLPFTDVYVHAMIQDGEGRKMSKSLGNGVDPLDIIHSHGSDAMRYTLAAMTTNTQDVRMPVVRDAASGRNTSEKFDLGRNFANKIWNAVRFALGNLESRSEEASRAVPAPAPPAPGSGRAGSLQLADKWILSHLAAIVRDTDAALANYEFSNYAQGLYDFIWRDLCDWYIEAIKPTVHAPAPGSGVQRRVLALCIDASLRLLHPVMPFITEKLWERLNEVAPIREISGVTLTPSDLLIHAAWPKVAQELIDPHADAEFALIQQVVTAIRQVRTTYQVPPKQRIVCSAKTSGPMAQRLLDQRPLVETLANIEGREIGPGVEKPTDAAATVVDDVEIYVHGLVQADAEKARLSKRLDEVAKSVAALNGRLSNKAYTDKAPPHLVQQTRDQLAAAEREKQAIEQQLAGL